MYDQPMKKLLWRVLLNIFGFSLMLLFFGWFLIHPPGKNNLIDLEQACQRLNDVHLCCHDRPDGSREGWSLVYTPEGQLQLDQQCQLARSLYRLPADFQFRAWKPDPRCLPPEPDWVLWMCYGVNTVFFGLLVWANPIGRLLRSRRKLLICVILAAPSLVYVPDLYQEYRMRFQISTVVRQNFTMLWNHSGGHHGLVVILRQHPDEVEQALRARLQLQTGDQLSVVCITTRNPSEIPPHCLVLFALETLIGAWLTRRWLVPLWSMLV